MAQASLSGSTFISLPAGRTVFTAPDNADLTETSAEIRVGAGTFQNLRAYATGAPGSGQTFTLTAGVGTCGSALSYASTPTCAISGTGQTCDDTSATLTTTAGQCITVRIVASSTAAAAGVSWVLGQIS